MLTFGDNLTEGEESKPRRQQRKIKTISSEKIETKPSEIKQLDDQNQDQKQDLLNQAVVETEKQVEVVSNEGERAKQLKIVSPKGLKKKIQAIDLEAPEKNLHEKLNSGYSKNSNNSANSNSFSAKNSVGIWSAKGGGIGFIQTSEIQGNQLILQIALFLEAVSSMIVSKKNSSNEKSSEESITKMKLIAMCCFSVTAVVTVILAKVNIYQKAKIRQRIGRIISIAMIASFIELRVLIELQEKFNSNSTPKDAIELLIAGSILTWQIQQINQWWKELKYKIGITMVVIFYILIRILSINHNTDLLFELLATGISAFILSMIFSAQEKISSCLQNQINIGKISKESSNSTQVFSPKFGGGEEEEVNQNFEMKDRFFSNQAQSHAVFSNPSGTQLKGSTINWIKSSGDQNYKQSAKLQSTGNQVLSPKQVQDSMQFISPRDEIDSKRVMINEKVKSKNINALEIAKSGHVMKSNNELKEIDFEKDNTPPSSRREDSNPNIIKEGSQFDFKANLADSTIGEGYQKILRKETKQKKTEGEEEDDVGEDHIYLSGDVSQNISLFEGNERSDGLLTKKKQRKQTSSNVIGFRMEMQDLILSNLSSGIIVVSKETNEVVYANKQVCNLLNCTLEKVLQTLLQLKNIYSYKDEVLNFTEILQQFEKPVELSELSTLKGLFINHEKKKEVMICVLNGSNNSISEEKPKAAPSSSSSNSISIKNFLDSNQFLEIELDQIKDNNCEVYMIFSIKSASWSNPISVIHSTTLKVQYFIRKMISELSIDMNDIRDYFTNMKSSNVQKIDFNGCLGKIDCMTEFLQDFATSSLLISGTFIPIKSQMNLFNLVNSVVDKIRARTTSNQYLFSVHYENICPNVIYSDVKRLDRVFYNLLLYFIDTNETATIKIKVTGLAHSSSQEKKKIKVNFLSRILKKYFIPQIQVVISCHKKEDEQSVKSVEEESSSIPEKKPVTSYQKKKKEEGQPFSLSQKKANITNVYMLENMHYGVLLSNSIIQKLEPADQGIFFQPGSVVSFSFKLSI